MMKLRCGNGLPSFRVKGNEFAAASATTPRMPVQPTTKVSLDLGLSYICFTMRVRIHQAVRAEPLGEFWQRCSYLELLLEYTERCAAFYPIDDIRGAIHTVLVKSEELEVVGAPEEQLRRRVRKLIETAHRIQAHQRKIRWWLPRRLAEMFGARRRHKNGQAKD